MIETLGAAIGCLWALGAATQPPPPPPLAISCPAGTQVRGFLPPEGFEQWCEKTSDGGVVRHGPYRAWHSNGQPFIDAEYCSSSRCGRYAEWYASGRPKSLGEFDTQGRYQGHWAFWNEDGSGIEQDFTDGQLVRSVTVPSAESKAAQATAAATPTPPPNVPSPNVPPPTLVPNAGVGGSAWVTQTVPTVTAAVVCPPGAIPGGEPFPQGLVQWCQKRDRYGRWVRHGILREWYPNGLRRSESDYVEGRPTGWVTRWYPNGQKAEETHFHNGVPDGKSAHWTEEGILLGEEVFDHGRRVNVLRGPAPRWPAPP